MSAFAIQKIEVLSPGNEKAVVRLFLADHPDQDQATEWLSAQVETDARNLHRIATIQLTALQKLHKRVETEIVALERLLSDRSSQQD